MSELIRDAPLGQFLRRITGNSILLHPEERPDFDYASVALKPEDGDSGNGSEQPFTTITWYSADDKANPQNWALGKKCFVHFLICLLTFAIYGGSSIVTPAQPFFREQWGVSAQSSLLVLSMYVLGYGTGPLFFSPLSEIPVLGRSFPYVVSYSLFLILSIPAALVNNYPGLVVLRFLQGFFGGPVLATGGASAADMFSFPKLPYAMSIWVFAAYGGPALGPLLSVYAVKNLSWHWVMYEILIIGGVTGVLLVCFLPETNPETILLERAKRLRKVTGRSDLLSASEQKPTELKLLPLLGRYLWTPFEVPLKDPAILFTDVYTALVYGIYYSFFESFPVAYGGVYGFSAEKMSLVFVALLISCGLGVVIYVSLVWFIYEPYTMSQGIGIPEYRLVPGVYAAALLPFSLFLFGWATRPEINWAVPSIGLLIFPGCAFVLIQVIFLYLPTSYPRYAASILAGNTFLRSATACAAIHFSQPMFENLGVGKGNSILGGICVACFFCFAGLWYFGPKLRAKSKFAEGG